MLNYRLISLYPPTNVDGAIPSQMTCIKKNNQMTADAGKAVGKGRSYSSLVGMLTCITTVEFIVKGPQKARNRTSE